MGTSVPTSTSMVPPPLTTVFTPPNECVWPWLMGDSSNTDTVLAQIFPDTMNSLVASVVSSVGEGPTGVGCYPREITSRYGTLLFETLVLGVHTYSPGDFCPYGMTTVDTTSFEDGVFCGQWLNFQGRQGAKYLRDDLAAPG
ncbi:hypothetical protein F4780DRAFT_763842 [Xylariomycetidae sp. FL0641]|nr:hypothetical protein F4780DRAFT_763842 [Xylariomycetidae sp. FL0641]